MSESIQALVEKVLAIRRGELPPDAVTVEELREAIAQQRRRFAETPAATKKTKTTESKRSEDNGTFSIFDDISL